jgi:hypothetical protein
MLLDRRAGSARCAQGRFADRSVGAAKSGPSAFNQLRDAFERHFRLGLNWKLADGSYRH